MAAPVTCPRCGHDNEADANYCSSCGTALAGDLTGDHPVVDLEDEPGAVEVDRSGFGPHEGLFVVVHGDKAGSRYALDAEVVTVGRHPASDIFLDDITVSRRHAEVRRDGTRYRVRDAGSLNGTYVNRERVEEAELADGDELQVGKFKLVFAHGTGTV